MKWMEAPFGFHELRITSKEEAKQESLVRLNRRFHSYTPILAIFEVDETSKKPVSTVKLDCTKFTTVRVVLNKEVDELKRQNNIDKDALRTTYDLVDEEDLDEDEENRGGDEDAAVEFEVEEECRYEGEDGADADGA